jgi:DNA polymerase III alpha subunit (gram-positive type)
MQSPLRTIIVYDLETGGLDFETNPITEMAMVAVNLDTLEIIDELSIVFLPRMDLRNYLEESIKEAKAIFNDVATKDEATGIKTLFYKGQSVTPKTIDSLSEDIEKFREYLNTKTNSIIDTNQYFELQKTEFSDISTLYLNRAYNQQALDVTHMSLEMLLDDGVEFKEGFEKVLEFIKKHTVGNNKPIVAGHNIKSFDNKFMLKLFADNKDDFNKHINSFMIDSLEWVRLRWSEMPSYSLGVCANALGLTLKEAHRALPDTIANAKLIIKLLKSLRGEGTKENVYVRPKFDFNF